MQPQSTAPKAHALTKQPLWFSAFVLLLVLLPLPFGSNRPWSSDIFAVITGVILCAMLVLEHKTTSINKSAPIKRLLFSAACVSLVALWSFVQIMPWTPTSWHHPVWQDAASMLGPVRTSISIDTGLFTESFIRFLAYVGCFAITFTACRSSQQAKAIIKALAFAAVAYAAYGILVQSSGSNMVLWYPKWAYLDMLTSTFVNKNSYATYAGLGLLCTIAYVMPHFKNLRPNDPVLAQKSKLAALVATFSYKEYALAFMPTIVFAALVLTGSRAGIISAIAGLFAFTIALAVHYRWRAKSWAILAGTFLVLLIVFLMVGGEVLLSRMGSTALHDDTAMRGAAYSLALQAINDNPWLGFGLGTFESAFRLYRDETLPLWFHHAHNDYLEMAMDLGIPAFSLLLLGLFSLVSCCFSGLWKRRRDGLYPALAIGSSAIVCAHTFADFSMHIPAVAATYASLLGVGVAQSWSSRETASQDVVKKSVAPNAPQADTKQPRLRTHSLR